MRQVRSSLKKNVLWVGVYDERIRIATGRVDKPVCTDLRFKSF